MRKYLKNKLAIISIIFFVLFCLLIVSTICRYAISQSISVQIPLQKYENLNIQLETNSYSISSTGSIILKYTISNPNNYAVRYKVSVEDEPKFSLTEQEEIIEANKITEFTKEINVLESGNGNITFKILAPYLDNYIFEITTLYDRGYIKRDMTVSESEPFLETDVKRNQINSISFLGHRNIPDNAIKSFDVTDTSKRGDNVKLWYYKAEDYTDETPLYDIYIGTTNEIYLTNGNSFFKELKKLKEINFRDENGNNRFNTSEVTNMSSMFNTVSSLTNIDLSGFDTANVTTMANMFNGCGSLINLDLSNFNTSKVNDMRYTFCNMSSVENINLSSFDTANVTSMSNMFNGCSSLINLDLSGFNTSNVTSMHCMFRHLVKMKTLILSTNFNTSKVTNMSFMFQNNKGLVELDLSMFDTSKVTSMTNMFNGSNKLKTIYVSDKFTTANVSESVSMFMYCTSIVGGQGTIYDDLYLDKTYARIDEGETNPGYFTSK